MRQEYEQASDMIAMLWQQGEVLDALPPELKPATRVDGYVIQSGLERYSSAPRYGWKIAATSVAGQRHIGVDGPLAGRLFAERIYRDGAVVSIAGNRMRVAEPEFAFRFGQDLPPRDEPYTVDEVMNAVANLHLTLELPDSRFADFASVGGPALIADNACAHDLVVGPPVPADWRAMTLAAHRVTASVAGKFDREGGGGNVLGDPCEALLWLANELSALGIGLRRDELVTTGACVQPLEIVEGDRIAADFGVLGQIGVTIAG